MIKSGSVKVGLIIPASFSRPFSTILENWFSPIFICSNGVVSVPSPNSLSQFSWVSSISGIGMARSADAKIRSSASSSLSPPSCGATGSPPAILPFAAGVFPCPPVPPLFGGVPACSVLSVFLRSTAALLAASICFLFASLYRFITFFNISSRLGTPSMAALALIK